MADRFHWGTAEQQNYYCGLDNYSFPFPKDDLVYLRVMSYEYVGG